MPVFEFDCWLGAGRKKSNVLKLNHFIHCHSAPSHGETCFIPTTSLIRVKNDSSLEQPVRRSQWYLCAINKAHVNVFHRRANGDVDFHRELGECSSLMKLKLSVGYSSGILPELFLLAAPPPSTAPDLVTPEDLRSSLITISNS